MNLLATKSWSWIWPNVGATPINQGLDFGNVRPIGLSIL